MRDYKVTTPPPFLPPPATALPLATINPLFEQDSLEKKRARMFIILMLCPEKESYFFHLRNVFFYRYSVV